MKILLLLICSLFAKSQTVTWQTRYYDLTYDTVQHHPVYGHYYFTAKNFIHKGESVYFSYDKHIKTVYQHGSKDYKNKSYDKGHIIPNDDFRFDSLANKDVNVWTNVVPEVSSLNRGVWKSIENFVRKRAALTDTVEVWTGVLYAVDKFIPIEIWKVLRYGKSFDAFMVTNIKQRSKSITPARVNLRTVEDMTGVKF